MKKLYFLFILLFLISCSAKESELKKLYCEVIKINGTQYITLDNKGNIHLISADIDAIILYYIDIESSLNRNFTLKEIRIQESDKNNTNKKKKKR